MNSKFVFRTLTIVHLGLSAGQLIFAGVVYFLHQGVWDSLFPSSNTFFAVALVITFAMLFWHKLIYRKIVKESKHKTTLSEKMTEYQRACMIKFAMIEIASITWIVLGLFTQNIYFLFFAGILLLYFISLKPKKEQMMEDLQLNRQEKELIRREF